MCATCEKLFSDHLFQYAECQAEKCWHCWTRQRRDFTPQGLILNANRFGFRIKISVLEIILYNISAVRSQSLRSMIRGSGKGW